MVWGFWRLRLKNKTVARYNLITPDQYNDMHTALTGGFTYNEVHYTGDSANIAQGDNFGVQNHSADHGLPSLQG